MNTSAKKKLVLHIGSHKTATTFIQGSLAKNAEVLKRIGLLYPEAGKIYDAHFRLCWKLKSPEHAESDLTDIDDWAALIDEIKASPAKVAVISSEEFSSSIDPVRLIPLMDHFDVQIVHYLRSPESFLESFYNQFIKDFGTRETRTINTYVAEERLHFLDTRAVLKPWLDVFGPDRMSVRIFSRQALQNGILVDFMRTIGVSGLPILQAPDVSVLHKVSLPPDALEYLRFANANLEQEAGHHAFVVRLVQMAQDNSAALQSTRAGILSLKARKTLRHRFVGQNIWAAKTFLETDKVPFPVHAVAPPPPGSEKRPEIADASVIGRVAAMIQTFEKK